LQHYAEKGAKAIIIWKWWNVFAYPRPIGGYEEKFRRLVRECHRHGIKVLPYVGGFVMSEKAPEAAFFSDEMGVYPKKPFELGKLADLPLQGAFVACQRGPWQDFMVHGIGRLIDEYDVDGVYLDTTTRPYLCANDLHGCGYVKQGGDRCGIYPVFSVRDNLRRIYNAVKQRKPDGIVDVHVYDCMNLPGLAWATSYWNGEQLVKQDQVLDSIPLNRFRAEFMGVNWGVPADFLYYKLRDYRKGLSVALLHDIPVRPENLSNLDLISKLWATRDRFGVKEARWFPYWSNRDLVTLEPDGCEASLHAHPSGRTLLHVASFRKEAVDLSIRLNTGELGLPTRIWARDVLEGGAPYSSEAGSFKLRIPAQDFKVLWIDGTPGEPIAPSVGAFATDGQLPPELRPLAH